MRLVMAKRAVVPATGDYVVVGGKPYLVTSYDPRSDTAFYMQTYADKDDPRGHNIKGYSLADSADVKPRVWRQPGDKLQWELSYVYKGRRETVRRWAESSRSARNHLLFRLGQDIYDATRVPRSAVIKAAKDALRHAAKASESVPIEALVTVTLVTR